MSRITQSVSNASSNLLFGFAGFGVSGLIGGNIISQSCATGVLGWQVWRDDKNKKKLVSKESLVENAKKYCNFPLVNSFHAFLDASQTSGVVFVISAFFGSIILGFYSFTLRILRMPLSLIGSSVAQVFYQKASETYSLNGDLHILLRKTMLTLALIALPMFSLIAVVAPTLFAFCFGENWREAGVYAQILSPWIFLNFITSPVTGVYLIVGKQKQALWFALADILTKIGSIVWGGYCNNVKYGFMAMSVSGVLILVVGIAWTFTITSNKDSANATD